MAQCAFCKTETQLYHGDSPICVKCSDEQEGKWKPPSSGHRVLTALHNDFQAATRRVQKAVAAFDTTLREIPSGLPAPDGTQRIRSLAEEVTQSRVEMMRAHGRLNQYLSRGIVPDDLKRGG